MQCADQMSMKATNTGTSCEFDSTYLLSLRSKMNASFEITGGPSLVSGNRLAHFNKSRIGYGNIWLWIGL